MSTILKALRRLEREKQPEPGKPLRDDVVAFQPGEPTEAISRRELFGLAAGAALLVVLGGLWLASGQGGGEAPESAEIVARTPVERAAADPPMRSVAPLPGERARIPPAPRAASPVAEPTPDGLARDPSSSAPGSSSPTALAAQAPAGGRERPYRLPDPEPLAAFEPPSTPATPAARPPPAASAREPSRTATLDPIAAPAVPAKVESTTWHPEASRRQARVNAPGRGSVTLREGDAVGEFVILRIEPAGVVFLYRGQEIHQRVGE